MKLITFVEGSFVDMFVVTPFEKPFGSGTALILSFEYISLATLSPQSFEGVVLEASLILNGLRDKMTVF